MGNAHSDALSTALASPEVQRGESSHFWEFVERDGDVVYFEVFAWDGEKYLLQLKCDRYFDEPIGGLFVDSATRHCTVDAWPHGDGTFTGWFKYSPSDFFICWPGDRGGIGRHPDWRGLAHWKKTPNPLHQYLEFISQCLTIRSRGYQPRNPTSSAA